MQQLIEQFIRERMYFKNVSPKTVLWYRQAFVHSMVRWTVKQPLARESFGFGMR